MNTQLDLFLDSRPVMLANEAVAALLARDAFCASAAVAALQREAPEAAHLPALQTLVHALIE